jgi:hypothetical protein
MSFGRRLQCYSPWPAPEPANHQARVGALYKLLKPTIRREDSRRLDGRVEPGHGER